MDPNQLLGADSQKTWRCHDVAPLALLESGDSQQAAVLMNCSIAQAERRLQALAQAGQLRLAPDKSAPTSLQYQWHEAVRLTYLERLLTVDAPLLPDIYLRAEPWLRQAPLGQWVQQALQQHPVPPWAQWLAGRMCRRWLQLHDAISILHWIDSAADISSVQDANVRICVIWALIMHQQYDRAELALQRLQPAKLVQDPMRPLHELDATVRVLQVWLGYYRDMNMPRHTRLGLLESCMDQATILQPMLLNQYALLQYSSGNLDLTRESAERAAQLSLSLGNLVQYQLARGWLMAAQFMLGKGFAAWLQLQNDFEQLQQQQLLTAEKSDPALDYAIAIHQACQAFLCYEANQIQPTQRLLTQSLQVLQKSELGLPRLLASVTQAKLFLDQGDSARAESLLVALDRLPEALRNPRIQAIICYERMRARWSAGQPVSDLVEHYQLQNRCVRVETLFQDTYQEEHLFWLKSRLLSYLINEDYANASEFALKGVIKSMGLRCQRHLATFYLFKALSEYRLKREADAIDSYNQALLLCQQSGYRRVLVDDGAGLRELLQLMRQQQRFLPQLNQDFLDHVRDDLQAWNGVVIERVAAARLPATDRLLSLTDKEIEILKLLAEGLCNKKIAHRASIALTTVKWHLQNIFSKLEARNRTEAVLKAQEMQLVEGLSAGR